MTSIDNFQYPTKNTGAIVVFSPFSNKFLVGSSFNNRMFKELLEYDKLPHMNESARIILAENLIIYFWIMTLGATKSFKFNKNLIRKQGLNGRPVGSKLLYELLKFYEDHDFIKVDGKMVELNKNIKPVFNKDYENYHINGDEVKKVRKSTKGKLNFICPMREFKDHELKAIGELNDPKAEEHARILINFIEHNTTQKVNTVMLSTRLVGRLLGCSEATARRRLDAFMTHHLIECVNPYHSEAEKIARKFKKHEQFKNSIIRYHDFKKKSVSVP